MKCELQLCESEFRDLCNSLHRFAFNCLHLSLSLFPVEFELRREIRRLQEYRKAGIKSFCSESSLTFSFPPPLNKNFILKLCA